MGVNVIDNFDYRGKKGNFERDKFVTLKEMHDFPEIGIDEGHICFCEETNSHYKFNSTNNTDATTGKWRLHNKSANSLNETEEGRVLDARQGKTLKDLIDAKVIEAGGVSFDTTPTEDSTNPVTSDGIKKALDDTSETLNNNIDNLSSNIGIDEYPTFSESDTYSAGDVVNYQGKLYAFTTDHAAGAWTGSDVKEKDVVKAHIVHGFGDNEDKVISQKEVTEVINDFGQQIGNVILINQAIDGSNGNKFNNEKRASFASLLLPPFTISLIDPDNYQFISEIKYSKDGNFISGKSINTLIKLEQEEDDYLYNITIKRKDDGTINDLGILVKFDGHINISISDIKENINDIKENINDIKENIVSSVIEKELTLGSTANKYAIFKVGQKYSLSDSIDLINASHTELECKENSHITYTTIMYSAIDLIGFLDSNENVISVVSKKNNSSQIVSAVAPSGTVKMVVNRQIQQPYSLIIKETKYLNEAVEDLRNDINISKSNITALNNAVEDFDIHSYTLQNNIGAVPISGIIYDYNIILTYGQSLAVGNGFQTSDTNSPDNCYMLGDNPFADGTAKNSAELKKLYFSKSENSVNFVPAISATAAFASTANRCGYSDKKFIAVGGGYSGYTVAQLMDTKRYVDVNSNEYFFEGLTGANNQIYQRVISDIERIKEIADRENKSVGVIAVVWIQGEGDYWGNNIPSTSGAYSCCGNKEEWKKRVNQLRDDFNTDFITILQQKTWPAWFIHNIQGGFIAPSFTINEAQEELCDNVNMFSLQPIYQLPNVNDQHLTGNGYRWYGEIIAQCMYDVLICNREPQCLKLAKCNVNNDKIILYMKVPVAPLQINKTIGGEVKDLGFYITKNSNKINIENIVVKSNCIIITTDTELSGNIVIEYATRNSEYTNSSGIADTTGSNGIIAGSGNICDSANPYSFLIGAEDKGSESNPVEYSPNLQNKPYDLRHFLKAFKVELNL